ncbi:MAG: phosphonoacetaldehyde reductase [bacterium]|nr:phosphonoacetaldehyde reductase [bacterium]
MTDLVACLGTGKGTLEYIKRLIEGEQWGKVFLLTNNSDTDKFDAGREVKFIIVDDKKPLPDLIEDIKKNLDGKISYTETALNIVAGEGKIHMALLSALLKMGLGIRLIALTREGVKEV